MARKKSVTAAVPPRRARKRVAIGPPRPQYLDTPDCDKLLMMLLALATEVAALRDRLDTHEALAEQGKRAARRAVEGYRLTAERHAQRETQRHAMLKRLLRVVTEEVDGLREARAYQE